MDLNFSGIRLVILSRILHLNYCLYLEACLLKIENKSLFLFLIIKDLKLFFILLENKGIKTINRHLFIT